MHKVTKRVLALLLACTLVFSSGMRSRSYAMAGGGVIAGGGAVIGAETALAYLLGILGFSAASAVVYDNRDSIAKWGKTQVGRLTKYIDEKKDQLNCTAESMQEWLTKLGKGTLDTAAAEWSAVKSWVGTLYDSGGVISTPITNQDDFTYNDGKALVGNFSSWVTPYDESGSGYDEAYLYCNISQESGKDAFFYSFKGTEDPFRICYIAVMSESEATVLNFYRRLVSSSVTTTDPEAYKAVNTCNGWYYTNPIYVSSSDKGLLFPNYVGVVNDDPFGYAKAAKKAYDAYTTHAFDAPSKTETMTKIGGISSAYNAGKTLDNISVVGVGNKAGVTDVTIPWPKDNSFGGLIGGAITGTNTWTDVIGAANVGVIEREGEKDWVIDNTGVTTKEWDYATDIPGTGGTDKPGTGEGDTDVDVPKDLGSYTFAGLEKLFPFCLPFDLIDFIGVLDADPEAPHFSIPIKIPTSTGWGTYDIDIDLSKFDQIAALMRQMETLAFVVGLIMITRQKMIRG